MSEATIRPDDIRWRVGQISKKDAHKGSLLGYIDARTCMEALDALDPEWSAVHGDPIIVGGELVGVPCTVTVNGVRRSDVGMPSSQEPIKGAYSDALKRAAVHFGIGRELYELPRIYVKLDDYKKPVAIPTYRNSRWTLPSGTGSVFYDREPEDQPERPARAPGQAAPVQPTEQQLRNRALELAVERYGAGVDAAMKQLADEVGVPKGGRATVTQLHQIIALIETPPADALGSAAATVQAPVVPPDGEPAPAPTLDDILEATGGELVPPKPGTDKYKALPSGTDRAAAKAYWEAEAVKA